MSPPPGSAPRRRLTPAARRDEILDAAGALLLDSGIEALTMERIAAQAGANKALPYYYFKTRDGVLAALAEREHARLSEAVTAAVAATDGPFAAKLRRILEVWIEFSDAQTQLSVLDLAQSRTGELNAVRAHHLIEATTYFADLMRADYPLSKSEALVLTGALMGTSQGIIPAWHATTWSRTRLVDTYVTLCIGAIEAVIAARPPSPPQTRS